MEYYGDTSFGTFGITASKDGISLGWDLDDFALTWRFYPEQCGPSDEPNYTWDDSSNCQLPIPEHWEAGTYDLNWVIKDGDQYLMDLSTGSTTVIVKLIVPTFPPPSVAVQVTVVVPTGKW